MKLILMRSISDVELGCPVPAPILPFHSVPCKPTQQSQPSMLAYSLSCLGRQQTLPVAS
jgi:hypothetical protein